MAKNVKAEKRRAERQERKIKGNAEMQQPTVEPNVSTEPVEPQTQSIPSTPTVQEQMVEKVRNEANAPATINAGTPTLPTLNSDRGVIPTIQTGGPLETTSPTAQKLGKPDSTVQTPAAPSFADMLSTRLAEMKEEAKQEKTDAVKMQKYHALANVLNSIGKLGGAAVGGAIGGNMADSAPNTGEYKRSQGYIDAFERAKKASDRLRDLDNQEYNLLARNEEREYNKFVRDAENEYKAQMMQLQREWDKEFFTYRSAIEQANAQQNMELRAKLEKEMAELQQKFKERSMLLQHNLTKKIEDYKYNIYEKKGEDKKSQETTPLTLNNGTKVEIPDKIFNELVRFYVDQGNVNGVGVDEDNVVRELRKNPNLVNEFLALYGIVESDNNVESPDYIEAETDVNEEYIDPVVSGYKSGRAIAKEVKQSKKNDRKAKRQVSEITSDDMVNIMGETPLNRRNRTQRPTTTVTEPYIDEDGIEWE